MRSGHPVLIALAGAGLVFGSARADEPAAPPASAPAVAPAVPQAAPAPNATATAPAPAPATPAPTPAQPTPATPPPAPAPALPAATAPVAAPTPAPAAAVTPPPAPAAAPTPAVPPHVVDSLAALQAAISAAVAGDTIILKNGVYPAAAAITIDRPGKAGQPITIAAESVGGADISGANGFHVVAPAAYVTVSGFVFSHASGNATIDVDTSGVRFTRNVFRCPGDGTYLTVAGDDAQVDHNEFAEKAGAGPMLAVSGSGSQIARRVWIHHNYFHDLANAGAEGAQMLRFGLSSSHGQSTGSGLVEHNLFARSQGVSDLISNRSSGNTYRYNTFVDSPNAHVTLQLGDDCLVYGNYFRNTEGLRIYGSRHQVFSNYFEKNYIALDLGNGAPDPEDGSPNTHARPDNCLIAFNTFLENNTHIQMSGRKPVALGASNTSFANNLFVGGGPAARFRGPVTGAVWSGNLVWNIANIGDLPPEGCLRADPMLSAGPDGIQRPLPGSPALGSSVGTFLVVTVDMEGRPRPEKKSRGADEPDAGPAVARFLTAGEVGPAAP